MTGALRRRVLDLFEWPGVAYRSGFRVGGVSVEIAGGRSEDVHLDPSLEPFLCFENDSTDVHIRVEWVERLRRLSTRPIFDSASVWRLYEGETGLQFDFHTPVLGHTPYKSFFVDRKFHRATLWLSQECLGAGQCVAPLEYPLDELLIMHRLTQECAIELHGCGIVSADGTGNLFVGHSGAGKSTTARLWTAREVVEVLSDDRIIVRRDRCGSAVEMPCEGTSAAKRKGIPFDRLRAGFRLPDLSASPTGHSAQDDRAARVYAQDDKAEKQIPRSARNDKPKHKMRMYGTPWHGEAAFASPASALLSRILILEHGHGNVLTQLSPGQVVAELFARSFVPFHRHEYLESALAFLEEVAGSVPCYRYSFEPDERAVDTILNFHD